MQYLAVFVVAALAATALADGPATCICTGAAPTNCQAWNSTYCSKANLESNFRVTLSSVAATCTDGVASSATCTTSSFTGSCPSATDATTICSGYCAAIGATSGTWACASSGSSSSSCFPANATVQLENGARKQMSEIAVGDKVLATTGVYSEVFMFSHKLAAARAEFVRLTTKGGLTLALTPNHYLYVNERLAVASTVKVGDNVKTAAGAADAVVGVTNVWADGLYNPHTMHGDIVVDGVQTSTYTADIDPTLAHAALWPVRMLHKMGKSVVGDAFASGSDLIAAIMPDGKKQY